MFVCPECGAAQGAPGACSADGTAVQAVGEDLLLGQTIGVYRVARLLGIGGMGRVYKGVHPTIGSRVAIKVLSRECSDRRDLVDRFFAEAKAVNVIRHESIVNVLDLAMLPDGRPYIIMEYLDGAPLSAIVDAAAQARMPLPLGGIARLAAEVLDALGAAHAKGIVHRDLKLDNIYVTPAGRAKVLDFGIAKLTDNAPGGGTATGSLLGTPHYMAPEQAMGRPVDLRADLYAMGVILFECATGVKPFTADALFDLLRKQVEQPPPDPRSLRPDLPVPIAQVILTALAKDPAQRFANAQTMSLALQHATSGLPTEAWTPITPQQGKPAGSPTPSWPSQPPSWAGKQQGPLAHQTTVSSGQVTGKPGSNKGLWIAFFALVLVGGGVTAAVVAGGGGSSSGGGSASVEAAKPSDEPANDEPRTANNDPAPAPAKAAAPAPAGAPAKAATAPTKVAAEKEDDDKDEPAEKEDDEEEKDPVAAIDKAVRTQNAAAPSANGWFQRHDVTPPSRDMKRVDVDAHIAWAVAEAKRTVPDAQLFRIDLENVFPDGHADLTLPGFAYKYGGIDLRFVSPSHAKRDPSIPRGVPGERMCSLRIDGGPDGFEIRDLGGSCDEPIMPPPKCKLKQVWAKVLAKHPDVSDAVASIDYRAMGKRPTWWFTIYREDHSSLVSETFPDDCK